MGNTTIHRLSDLVTQEKQTGEYKLNAEFKKFIFVNWNPIDRELILLTQQKINPTHIHLGDLLYMTRRPTDCYEY